MTCAIDQTSIAHQLRRNIGLRNWKWLRHSDNHNCAIENPSKTSAQLMKAPKLKLNCARRILSLSPIRRQSRKRAHRCPPGSRHAPSEPSSGRAPKRERERDTQTMRTAPAGCQLLRRRTGSAVPAHQAANRSRSRHAVPRCRRWRHVREMRQPVRTERASLSEGL